MTFDGLPEFLEQLRNLPADATADAGPIILAAAEDTRTQASAAYPEPRGNDRDEWSLKNGMKIKTSKDDRFATAAAVVHTAYYADIFENGTAGVRRKTSYGWNRGPLPAGNVFIPIAIRRRLRMYEELAAMVRGYGAEVSTTAGGGFL